MDRRDLAVFTGGVVGTALRAGLAGVLPSSSWPWGTFVANLAGTFTLAVVIGWAMTRLDPADLRLRFLATGVLGSFTTFSAFAVEIDRLGPTGRGAAYGLASVLAGVVLAHAGLATAPSRMRGGR